MSDHRHVVGLSGGLYGPLRFAFCPECGASLSDYWEALDAEVTRRIASKDLEFNPIIDVGTVVEMAILRERVG